MLNLKNVTLLGIDVVTPEKTLSAMLYSMRYADFGDAVLATDTARHTSLPDRYPIRLHPIKQSNVTERGSDRMYFKEYAWHQLTLPAEIISTDYVLMQDWDAAIIDPLAWNAEWLKTDYIGALWPDSYCPGWPPAMTGSNVGNGGFSLRSKRLCSLVRTAAMTWHYDPGLIAYDRWICRTMRPWLEQRGVVFASEEQALRFSCEDAIYTGQFGFHGKTTAKINGWSLPWF